MDPVTLRWVQAELSAAMDLYDRCITGLRLTPVSTKAVDAAGVLFESVRPLPEPADGQPDTRPPYHGLPGHVVIDGARLAGEDGQPLLPSVPAETVVVDHGKIYLSEHLMTACARLGISPAGQGLPGHRQGTPGTLVPHPRRAAARSAARLQGAGRLPARQEPRRAGVLLPRRAGTDRPAVDRGVLSPAAARGPVHSRGARPGSLPAGDVRPRDRQGRLPSGSRPRRPGARLPQGGVANHPALRRRDRRPALRRAGAEPLPQPHQPLRREHAGRWPLRLDPGDVSRVWFQDPAGDQWHALRWEHAAAAGRPVQQRGASLRPAARGRHAPVPRHPARPGRAAGAVGRGAGRKLCRAADGAAAVRAAAAPGPGPPPAAGALRARRHW